MNQYFSRVGYTHCQFHLCEYIRRLHSRRIYTFKGLKETNTKKNLHTRIHKHTDTQSVSLVPNECQFLSSLKHFSFLLSRIKAADLFFCFSVLQFLFFSVFLCLSYSLSSSLSLSHSHTYTLVIRVSYTFVLLLTLITITVSSLLLYYLSIYLLLLVTLYHHRLFTPPKPFVDPPTPSKRPRLLNPFLRYCLNFHLKIFNRDQKTRLRSENYKYLSFFVIHFLHFQHPLQPLFSSFIQRPRADIFLTVLSALLFKDLF